MIIGLDSASQPTAFQAKTAASKGIKLWSGYLATKYDANGRNVVGLYSPWSRAGFDNARLCGSVPIAFCSGWDDPLACARLAASWGVRLCLDVEGGIRGNGSWVQEWLDASGAGLYGNAPVHPGRRAAFHVLAAYPIWAPLSPPTATWSGARPPGPCGWQWRGTHSEFGVGVDRGNYDDWFATAAASAAEGELGGFMGLSDDAQQKLADQVDTIYQVIANPTPTQSWPALQTKLSALQVSVNKLPTSNATTDLSSVVQAAQAAVTAAQAAQSAAQAAETASAAAKVAAEAAASAVASIKGNVEELMGLLPGR